MSVRSTGMQSDVDSNVVSSPIKGNAAGGASERGSNEETPNEEGPNEATEIIGGAERVVEVSKHPDASIPETNLSLADIQRRQFRPMRWVVYALVLLVAIIAPYWVGRALAVDHTEWVSAHFGALNAQGGAFLGWTIALVSLTCLGMVLVDSKHWLWRILFAAALAVEQFVGGVSLLKVNFWYSTYVVYGDAAGVANAVNLGILGAGFALAAFAVIWVGLLVLIRKDSPLNVLTRSWASFILFFVIETIALVVVMFGGVLAMA